MDAGQGAPARPQGHTRNVSSRARRQAVLRESTSGPLEADDPLSQPPPPTQSPNVSPPQPHHLAPEASLSSISRSSSRSPVPPAPGVDRTRKDFGFLLRPDIFHPLTYQDVPAAFRGPTSYAASESSIPKLLGQGRFRAAAVLAAELLRLKSNPTDYSAIFPLFHTRLACLQIAGLHEFAAQESKALQDLNAPFYVDQETGKHLAPWELRVLAVRLQAIGFGDWRRGMMGYYELAREARLETRRMQAAEDRELWKDRLHDIGVRVGNALVEMGDNEGAVRHLQTLPAPSDLNKQTRLALLLLKVGDVDAASQCFSSDNAAPEESSQHSPKVLDALRKMSETSYEEAIVLWQQLKDSTEEGDQYSVTIANNLAVCLVYVGRIHQARNVLESLIDQGASNRSVLFNLSTVYELCSDKSREHKLAVADKVATQPATPTGWEHSNADFKL